MEEESAAVDVAQEIVTQTSAFGGAVNESGDIGGHEAVASRHLDNAQIGGEGGEMVVGDLGTRRADAGQQGGLTHAGVADEAHVGDHLQLHEDLPLLAAGAVLGELGSLAGGGGEVAVAPAPSAASAADVVRAAVLGHIVNDLARGGVLDDSPFRHREDQILSVGTVELLGHAVTAVLGGEVVLVAVSQQGIGTLVHAKDDITAIAAVTPAGAAVGDVLLSVEGNGTVPAVAGLQVDFYVVEKLHKNMTIAFARRKLPFLRNWGWFCAAKSPSLRW